MLHEPLTLTIIKEQLNIINDDISLKTELDALPNWDSLRALRIMKALETHFETRLPLKSFYNAKTVSDLLDLVSRNV